VTKNKDRVFNAFRRAMQD